jgi:hypothetical protein
MNYEGKRTEELEAFAEQTDILAWGPGVDDFWRAAIFKKTRPLAIHLREVLNQVMLLTQSGPEIIAPGHSHSYRVTHRGEVIRKVMDVDGAVRTEVMI